MSVANLVFELLVADHPVVAADRLGQAFLPYDDQHSSNLRICNTLEMDVIEDCSPGRCEDTSDDSDTSGLHHILAQTLRTL